MAPKVAADRPFDRPRASHLLRHRGSAPARRTAGIDAARLALRKPESTTGDGDEKLARRVEVRILS